MQFYNINFTVSYGDGVDRLSDTADYTIPSESSERAKAVFLELANNSVVFKVNDVIWPVKAGGRVKVNTVTLVDQAVLPSSINVGAYSGSLKPAVSDLEVEAAVKGRSVKDRRVARSVADYVVSEVTSPVSKTKKANKKEASK
jgi:hypothetical protein